MICESCGGNVQPGDEFCQSCGAKVEEKKEVEVQEVPVEVIPENEVQVEAQGQQTQPASGKTGFAIAGLVLGILGLIAWLIPLLGWPVTIVGIIMSAKGMKTTARGMAIAGMVLSIIGLLLSVGNSVLGVCIYLFAATL